MPRRLLALAIIALLPAPANAQPRSATAATAQARAFDRLTASWIEAGLRLNPTGATQLGDHRFDARLPDLSASGRAERRALAQRTAAALARIDPASLTPQQRVDAALLADRLAFELYDLDTIQSWAWDATQYTGLAGGALYGLVAREFAPLPARLASATARLEALPAMLAQTRAALVPARVPPTHAITALAQHKGLAGLIDGIVAQSAALPAPARARLARAAATAKTAAAEHQTWLETTLVPAAKGEPRYGPARYDEALRLTLGSPLTRPEIKARALATVAATRAEMYRVATTLLAGRPDAPPTPAAPTPAQQQAAIAAALAISYADTAAPDQVVPFARETLEQATAFAKEKDFISFPVAEFEIIEMPEFARGFAVAYADSPGPLEKTQRSFYAVSPIPAGWTPEQTASFLREYNKWAIHELTIHEAMPGHLLQLAHSNRYKSTLRAVLASGAMIEGWAMYSEDVMAEAGYLQSDPRYRLAHLKFRLRATMNALLDIGFHTENLQREEAMRMMTVTAFQEEREAAGKWTRMQLSATQLPTYFVGYSEWRDLRAEGEGRPGFTLKSFHDTALSYGSPPVRHIRALMFGAPPEGTAPPRAH